MTQESILEKVQKLLSKTVENGCTQEEAQAAAALAQTLLSKYNLSISAVADEDVFSVEVSVGTKTVSSRQALLALLFAKHYGCKVVRRVGIDSQSLLFIGENERPKVVKETFYFIYKVYQTCWDVYKKQLAFNKAAYRNDYFNGFLQGLEQALIYNENKNSIVLRVSTKVDAYIKGNLHTQNSMVSCQSKGKHMAYIQGYSDGYESQLSKEKRISA